MIRNLILNVATAPMALPSPDTVFNGYKFQIILQNPAVGTPADQLMRTLVSPEPSVMFEGLEVGSIWAASCQAVQPDSSVFGPLVEALVEVTPGTQVGTYPAPTGLSFLLD